REVPDEVLLRCIDLAEQAPSGGNVASRRWLVIRDPDTKARLAALYRSAGGRGLIETAERLRGSGHARERVVTSAAYLAQHLERVPVLLLVTIWGTHDGSGRPGLFDSVLQAAWSFCLALRARGLGSTWTTLHLGRAHEVAELLGIPDGVTQVVLLPVAYTHGTDFTPATRRPAAAITWVDLWGDTNETPRDARSPPRAHPGPTAGLQPPRIPATAAPCWPPVRGSPWKSTSPPHRRVSGSWCVTSTSRPALALSSSGRPGSTPRAHAWGPPLSAEIGRRGAGSGRRRHTLSPGSRPGCWPG